MPQHSKRTPRRTTRGALTGAVLAATTLIATVGYATAQTPITGTVVSTCDNPVLNHNLDGWGRISGSAPYRPTFTDHPVARAAYVQANNPTPDPKVWLPQQPVAPGEEKTFSVDIRSDMAGEIHMEVDWYSASGAFLGHVNGPATVSPGGTPLTWRRVTGDFTAPAHAARANVLVGSDLPAGADLAITACSYLPTGADEPTDPPVTDEPDPTEPPVTDEPDPTEPPVTDPPDPTEPPGDSTEAAVLHGWGTPLAQWSDEFNYQGPVDPAKWEVPNGCWPGHDGNGRRCGENSVVDGSKLVMTGEANADTAWVRSTQDADYGRWEIRMRSETTGPSGNPYHILALLWPSSERWPQDGEFDWVENFDPDANCVSSFIHYPHRAGIPVQQEYAEKCPVDANTWTNYAVEWTPQHVKGFVNGEEWFSWSGGANADRRNIQDMQPEGQLTFQVDAFYPGNMRPAKMEVDWMRTYDVP